MTNGQKKVMTLLCQFGRTEILKDFRPDSCIASTKVAIKVCKHFNINIQPLASHVEVQNPIFVQKSHCLKKVPKTTEEQLQWADEGAYVVRIEANPTTVRWTDVRAEDVGHVIGVTTDHLLDLSLDQASRPKKGIILHPGLAALPTNFMQSGARYIVNDCMVIYWPVQDNTSFRSSRDWKIGYRTDPAVRRIIKKIESRL